MANGSKVREMAEAEAARAEAEDTEQESEEAAQESPEPASPEPPAEDQPEPTPEELAQAEQITQLERAQETYLKRVEKVLGPEAMPGLCPTCNGTGLDFAGHEAAPEYREHHKFIECDDCAGFGKVRTGSRVIGQELADCPKCVGRGFLEELPAIAAVPQEAPTHGAPSWMGNAAPAPLP